MDFAILQLHCSPYQEGKAMSGKSFTITYADSFLSSLASLCLAAWHCPRKRFWERWGAICSHTMRQLCSASSPCPEKWGQAAMASFSISAGSCR